MLRIKPQFSFAFYDFILLRNPKYLDIKETHIMVASLSNDDNLIASLAPPAFGPF